MPGEPGKLRPAVVIEDEGLFPEAYPSTLVVPLTHDEGLAYPTFAVRLDPTGANGVDTTSWALAHHVTSVSTRRVKGTGSHVTPEELADVRRRVTLAIGA